MFVKGATDGFSIFEVSWYLVRSRLPKWRPCCPGEDELTHCGILIGSTDVNGLRANHTNWDISWKCVCLFSNNHYPPFWQRAQSKSGKLLHFVSSVACVSNLIHCYIGFPSLRCHASLSVNTKYENSIASFTDSLNHDDVIKWKHFPHNWPFVRGIHRSAVNSSHKGQWRGSMMFFVDSSVYSGAEYYLNNLEACDLRRHRAHDDVIVMSTHRAGPSRMKT